MTAQICNDVHVRHLQRHSLVDSVVDELRGQIAAGHWALGDRIPSEAELAATFGVSRTSVREAVRSLVQLGLLETRQGDGTYVVATDATQVALRRALTLADSREVIRVRRALDALAAREAAQFRSEEDVAFLAEQLRLRREAVQAGDTEAFVEYDLAYHLGVARASGNRLLTGIYASFDGSIRESVADDSCSAQGGHGGPVDLHEELLRAIEAKDPDAAQSAAIGVLEQQERLLDKLN